MRNYFSSRFKMEVK